MKTPLLLCALLGLFFTSRAQVLGKVMPNGYTSKMGTAVHKGDSVQFALGQREDGSFKYAETIPNILTPKYSGLPKTWANHSAVVKEVRGYANTRLVVFKAGAYTAQLDFDAAEQAGEIKTPNNQKRATPTVGGVADELIKLKGLLDSGVITQAEFDTQKAKLLK